MPSAATTSSNGRMRLTSSGSRSNRWASWASTWRRRARWNSSATSARGKPVSPGMGATPRGGLNAGTWLDLQQVPAHDVAHHGPADSVGAGWRAVEVDMPVQQQGGLEPRGEPVHRGEPLMRRVVAVPGARRRRVSEQHIDAAPVMEPAPPGAPGQGAGTPGLLPLGVLVGPGAVAAGAA